MAAQLGAAARRCSDQQLVGVISELCAERPGLHAHLQEVLSQPVAQRFVGVIARFDPAKSFGFIKCPEVTQDYGRDVFVSDKQIGNFRIGSTVEFTLTVNARGEPQAQELVLRLMTPQDFRAAPAYSPIAAGKGQPILPGKGGGASKGKGQAKGIEDHARYVGTIKRFDPAKHFGFIGSEEVLAYYGKDAFLAEAQLNGFENGSNVSFNVRVKDGKPQAQNLADPASGSSSPRGSVRSASPAEIGGAADPGQVYVGVINKFDPHKRFGFIQCEETHALYGRDVFLSDVQLNGFAIGATVAFALTVKDGKPQAQRLTDASQDLRDLEAGGDFEGELGRELGMDDSNWAEHEESHNLAAEAWGRADTEEMSSPPWKKARTLNPVDSPAAQKRVGTIKKFNGTYGFIDCPEVHAACGMDVFLSDKQVLHYQVGNTIAFRYELKQGKPQAFDLSDA